MVTKVKSLVNSIYITLGSRTASPELIDTEGLVQDRPTQTAY